MNKILFLLLIFPVGISAQSKVTSEFIDSIVAVSMDKFPQAGVAIGVIQNGEITHLKGYGIASKDADTKVDENTLFAIASNSKAFTTTALGMLVDQGKISWEDKVVDYIPEFRMYDSYVTENFTILDLLTHRSGLGLGAGDLMFFPDGSNFTTDDVIKSFQYQKPVSAFRTKYDYDNLLYMVAGVVIEKVSGKNWDKFIELDILTKLGMENSVGLYKNLAGKANVASPHKTVDDEIKEIEPYIIKEPSVGAAGGIYSNVTDMSKWVMMHLNNGLYGEDLDKSLISKTNHRELWKIHTNIYYNAQGEGPYKSHYKGYGLGFFLQDQNGYTVVNHTGGFPGMLSMVTIIPELNAGIVVLTNSNPSGLNFVTLTSEIKDEIIGAEGVAWIEWAEKRLKQSGSEADSVVDAVWAQVEKSKKVKIIDQNYIGQYRDNWFGEIEIYKNDNKLMFRSLKSPKLTGEMKYYQANTFAIAWDYQDMDCDAFAMFQLDENGKAISLKMKGISPAIDFSFDFHHLDLKRISK